MAILEQINSMKEGGMSEVMIINTLRDQGFSPLEINEGIGQSKIKAAVSEEIPEDSSQRTESGMQGMQASVMSSETGQEYISTSGQTGEQNAVQYAEAPAQSAEYPPAQEQAYYPPEQQAYPPEQQAYAPQEVQQGYYAQGLDLDTAKDIAKQEVDEALQKVREDLSELLKFRSDIKFEIQDVQNRLVKVEATINDLQYSVIKKVSEYGEQISGISQEIKMTQESFSKIVGPFMDKTRGIGREEKRAEAKPLVQKEEIDEKPKLEPKEGKRKKAKAQSEKPAQERTAEKRAEKTEPTASFEDYFR